MQRRTFLQTLLLSTGTMLTFSAFKNHIDSQSIDSELMPAMFIGHGSPMNAIEENEFTKEWKKEANLLPIPIAILCISAHWFTRGTFVAVTSQPETIHDFGGFPKALFDTQYTAPGAPELAHFTQHIIQSTQVQTDADWGLDHGTWSILKQMYPEAKIPVFQLSIDYTKPPQFHYELGKELLELRKKGVLIIGSGNIVHNLGRVNFQQIDAAYDWNIEFDTKIKNFINTQNHQGVIDYQILGSIAQLAVPSPDHYLPLLYTLGLQQKNEVATFFNEKYMAGSLSMTSVKIMKT